MQRSRECSGLWAKTDCAQSIVVQETSGGGGGGQCAVQHSFLLAGLPAQVSAFLAFKEKCRLMRSPYNVRVLMSTFE
jgi:hypothetical protein